MENLWFDDLQAEYTGDRLNIVFSRDVILCGWLGSKYQLTNKLLVIWLIELHFFQIPFQYKVMYIGSNFCL